MTVREGQRSDAPIEPSLLESFRGVPTSTISDNLDRMSVVLGLRPFHRSGYLLGTALTVRTRSGDNLAVHRALELIQPGEVLVVDGGGDTTRALVGEIMKTVAESRGAAGFVIDGAIRDARAYAESDFPCYARAAVPRGPYKNGPGEIDVPVSVGGWIVTPGDVVVGDEDGVVTFPVEQAAALLRDVRVQQELEAEVLESIRDGRYRGAYGGARGP